MYKHRMNTVMLQLEEVEKERDQVLENTIPEEPRPLVADAGEMWVVEPHWLCSIDQANSFSFTLVSK